MSFNKGSYCLLRCCFAFCCYSSIFFTYYGI